MQISEFSAWLRTQTSRDQRIFQEETICGYAETARALDLWMAGEDIDGDFTACSVEVLNRFFAAYRERAQPRCSPSFNWLASAVTALTELTTKGAMAGLAERVMGTAEVGWQLAAGSDVVLSAASTPGPTAFVVRPRRPHSE
jgi:hypothetical protein